MATPTNKSPEMTKALDSLTKQAFSRSRTASIQGDKCVICGGPAAGFKDEISKREYEISGLCQRCQDDTFGPDNDSGED